MYNIKFFPFERNNYFKGKVMSAESFKAEQLYINDKRRLINRLAGGFGIVCGLDTVAVADDKISVEAGVCIDGLGREIVVPSPYVVKLSALKGYDENKSGGEYYLCIEYAEKSDSSDMTEESYSLYLTESSEFAKCSAESYYRQYETLFINEDVEIRIIVPRSIRSKSKFPIEIRLIPHDVSDVFKAKLSVGLKCVRYNGAGSIDIDFDSRSERAKDGYYSLNFVCDGMNISYDTAEFTVGAGDLTVSVGNSQYSNDREILVRSEMVNGEPSDYACDDYCTELLSFVSSASEVDVCLAKIVMENFVINAINEVPFGHRFFTNTELAIENCALKDRINVLEQTASYDEKIAQTTTRSDNLTEISSGETVIDLGIGGKAGKRFFSEEISHGLGLGNVAVIAGIRDENVNDSSFVYGSSEIFDEGDSGIKAEIAVRVNSQTGTFKIGIRLLEAAAADSAVIHWTAIKRRENEAAADRRIIIDNGTKTLGILESAYFTVRFINLPPCGIRWSVVSQNGGSIDDNGCYTAPNHSGVFKIRAVCADDESVFASAYIVVKP